MMNLIYKNIFLTDTVTKEYPIVISKFIDEAKKEIEMDAVACNGQLINYAISEHELDAF